MSGLVKHVMRPYEQELFEASHLDAQLDDRASTFINSQVVVYVSDCAYQLKTATATCSPYGAHKGVACRGAASLSKTMQWLP